LLLATAAAIVGPAIRGIDKNDPAFGRAADWVVLELDKLAKKDKKKK
jgi:flagellar biosynthesis component FlhA